jgi:rubrerythrin
MTIEPNIIKKFQDILSREEQAFKLYNLVIKQVNDEFIKARLTQIRDDEFRHIKLAKEMLLLLQE